MREDAAGQAERVARVSYGRLLAILAASSRDIALAEDCLGDAFHRALATWSEAGVPTNPEAWLLTAARNRWSDVRRSAADRTSVALESVQGALSVMDDVDPDAIPDRRLALLFVCAHPAIAAEVRTPLMLQTVLGFDAAQIAGAFLVRAPTMSQRLVRAKRRIRDAGIPFVVPDRGQMPARVAAVLEAIYGAYALEWPVLGADMRTSTAAEAHYLAVTLAGLLPEEAEAHGLAALISLSLARSVARSSADDFLPLDEQDASEWDAALIAQGERHLRSAHALGRIGRFQLEAAIQSVHCDRARTGRTDWAALRRLYDGLVAIAPTLGAHVARAAVLGRTGGPLEGLAALDAIHDPAVLRFQPAWAMRAHLLTAAGLGEAAAAAWAKAISLTTDASVRRYLVDRARAAAASGK